MSHEYDLKIEVRGAKESPDTDRILDEIIPKWWRGSDYGWNADDATVWVVGRDRLVGGSGPEELRDRLEEHLEEVMGKQLSVTVSGTDLEGADRGKRFRFTPKPSEADLRRRIGQGGGVEDLEALISIIKAREPKKAHGYVVRFRPNFGGSGVWAGPPGTSVNIGGMIKTSSVMRREDARVYRFRCDAEAAAKDANDSWTSEVIETDYVLSPEPKFKKGAAVAWIDEGSGEIMSGIVEDHVDDFGGRLYGVRRDDEDPEPAALEEGELWEIGRPTKR